MVCLSPRFLLLSALVATAALPTFVLKTDARAVNLEQRHHDKSSHGKHSASRASKGHGKVQERPTIPLPPSAKAIRGEGKTSQSHKKVSKKHGRAVPALNGDTWDLLDPIVGIGGISIGDGRDGSYADTHELVPGLASILRRDPDSEHHHHHHHHHHNRREPETQVPFSLHRRARSRIYGKREQQIAETEKQEILDAARASLATVSTEGDTWDPLDPLLQIGKFEIGDGRHGSFSDMQTLLPRSPEPHHHHHHHHHHGDHDKVVVNGDNDKVHVHERREPHHHHHHHGDHDRVVVDGDNDDVHVHGRREPHHHHHHHHNDDHVHDKTVINGDNDNVHIHERRDPRHHHHHHHGEHKTVVNGNNDDVHIHNRGLDDDDSSIQIKRAGPLENMPGVPGTVDIMSVAGSIKEKLASLILSSVPQNSSSTVDGSKVADDGGGNNSTDSSPFVLDASNSTQTQFFLVAETAPSTPSAPSMSFANTLSVLKTAASSKSDVFGAQDIKVALQVMVFEPTEAAMRAYCATFDPNPPAPAALTMERCMSDDASQATGKMTETSLHKSQTFLYNPETGILRPKWFGVTDPLNATEPSASLPISSNSTASTSSSSADLSMSTTPSSSGGALDAKQMNFKIQTSNKNAPAHLPGPVSGAAGNVTLNGTLPDPSSLPASVPPTPTPSPQNVTLVFTPVGMAVHSVSGASDVAAFEPVSSASASDSGSESSSNSDSASGSGSNAAGNDEDASLSFSAEPTSTSPDSSSSTDSATTTDSASISESSGLPLFAFSESLDASSVSASATASASGSGTVTESISDFGSSSMPTASASSDNGVTIDEAAMEKMYQPRVS